MAATKPAHILVVDDDRSVQRVLAEALKKQGFDVTVERDGEWAVQSFENKTFDAVVLDLLLPALNGYEVAAKMRESPRGQRVPIIFTSGIYKSDFHQREAVIKHGAYAFLEKPIELSALYETLQSALGSRYPSALKTVKTEPAPVPPPLEDNLTGETMADDAQREEALMVERHVTQPISVPVSPPSADAPQYQPMRGDFGARPFAEVLAELHELRATGALLLRRDQVKKIVYLKDGVPQTVKSNLLVECLGQLLVREKMISEAECDTSLKRIQSSKRMQGTVLIEMGCLSPHNLQYALTKQLQDKLFDVFRWDVGEYMLNPAAEAPAEPTSVGLNVAQLILEGVKRTYDQARLHKKLAGFEHHYVHHSEDTLVALQDAGLNDEEQALMQLIDGHKTVATLRALKVLSRLETDQFLFAMKCSQMITLRPDPVLGKRMSVANMAALSSKGLPPLPAPMPPPLPVAPPPLPQKPVVAAPLAPPLGMPWPNEPEVQVPVTTPSLLPDLPDIDVGPRMSAAESVTREQLAAKIAAMRRLDYFEILNVTRGASREDVKRAYFGLAKEFHPDKYFDSKSSELRALAEKAYALISNAHDTLTDPLERERYVKEQSLGVKRDMGDDVTTILAAEGRFQRGEEQMRQRQYASAVVSFSEAISLYPNEGEFHAWLGWAKFHHNAADADAAMVSLEKAIALNSKLDQAYLFLGYIQKATGRPDKAQKQFEKAIQANPDCTEALRELRLLGTRRR